MAADGRGYLHGSRIEKMLESEEHLLANGRFEG